MNYDRRTFFGVGGGAFLCTVAGQDAMTGKDEVDLDGWARKVKEPPSVRRQFAEARVDPAPAPGGQAREVWLQAERASWDIVPTGRDAMMDEKVGGKTRFTAFVYRQYTKGWGKPIGEPSMPGPVLEATVGDTLVVNFRNRVNVPVTVHPHGVFYTEDSDGAYKGKYTQPGGFVKPGKTFRYVWDCREGTEGVWPYHDHGPLDPLPLYKGLFGLLHVRPRGVPKADRDHYIVFNALIPSATGLVKPYQCINGRSYAGNTPTLRARVGQRVAQHVVGLSNDFHTYHLHGHRWTDATGRVVDNVTVGPGDSYSLEFTEDNPGRWFYHCHVFSHLHEGMNGWYLVKG